MTQPPQNESAEANLHRLLDHAVARFTDRFGRGPTIAARAPGRVNLIGEHTDYNDGFVLPMAIDRYAVIVGAPSDDAASSVLWSMDLDQTTTIDLREPLHPHAGPERSEGPGPPEGGDPPANNSRWPNHLLGVIDQFKQLHRSIPNITLALHSTVPIGAGLSSSAAIEMAMATWLEVLTGRRLDPHEKVLLCQRAEHAFPGTPCGIMDMFISARAVADHALLIDCRTNGYRAVRLDENLASVLIVNTHIAHDLAASAYADRRACCHAVARKIGVDALRDATLAMLTTVELTFEETQRASHVITENTRTLLAAQALHEGDINTVGDLMFASHESLRDLYGVSCPELDQVVEIAQSMGGEEGVYGARLTGGGFGGCALVLCRPDRAQAVARAIGVQYRESFGREPDVFRARAVGGAKRMPILEPPTQ